MEKMEKNDMGTLYEAMRNNYALSQLYLEILGRKIKQRKEEKVER